MTSLRRSKIIHFEKPGKYRILVDGHLDESWSDRLAGMHITTTSKTKNGTQTTNLIGHLRDQTQLSGVLNALYELHLSILLVEFLEESNGPTKERVHPNESSTSTV